MKLAELSPGGRLIVAKLAAKEAAQLVPAALWLSRLGPLRSSVEGLVKHRLVERFAPGDAIAKTAIRLTPAGRALIEKDA